MKTRILPAVASILSTGRGELVLLLAGDLPLSGDVLRRVAHVIAVEGLPQAVLDHHTISAYPERLLLH
jgi:hypothetical protein